MAGNLKFISQKLLLRQYSSNFISEYLFLVFVIQKLKNNEILLNHGNAN